MANRKTSRNDRKRKRIVKSTSKAMLEKRYRRDAGENINADNNVDNVVDNRDIADIGNNANPIGDDTGDNAIINANDSGAGDNVENVTIHSGHNDVDNNDFDNNDVYNVANANSIGDNFGDGASVDGAIGGANK